ncbi:MAG TPA: hypothetical protein PLT76_09335 [Candidatus Omnitrophota bacterium]|nr:hypothetical protein [Candidatus Omnitrophota bacterium]
MAFHLKRYCIKPLLVCGAFIFLLFCLAVGLGTWRLNVLKDLFLTSLHERFPQYHLEAGPVFFLPPNGVIVKNFFIQRTAEQKGKASERILAGVPTTVLRFSVKKYFFEREISFYFFYLRSLRGDYPALLQAWGDLSSFLPSLSGPDRPCFTVKLREARLVSSEEEQDPDRGVNIHVVFRQTQRQLDLKGRLCPTGGRHCSWGGLVRRVMGYPGDLTFQLAMDLGAGKSRIKDLIIKHPQGEGNWRGLWDGHTAELSGYALWDTRRRDPKEGPLGQGLIPAGRLDPDLVILDMHGRVKVTPDEILVDGIRFDMNSIPVRISGRIGTRGELSTHFLFQALSPKLEKVLPGCHSIQADIRSHMKRCHWISSGTVTLLARSSWPLPGDTKVELRLSGLHVQDPLHRPGLAVEELTVMCPSGIIHLTGLDMFWNSQLNGIGCLSLTGRMYSGDISSRMWFKKGSDGDVRSFLSWDFQNLRLEDWRQDWPALSPLSGQVSGRYFSRLGPQFSMKGKMLVTDGVLSRVRFLEWFSTAFGFNAMKHLRFDTLFLSVVMDPSGIHFDRLNLNSDGVRIRGNLSLSDKNMVSSRISILMEPFYIKQSLELAQVLREKNPETLNYNFEFQLSGPADAVNFQWLPSEVKALIQKRIPDFIERRIERNIDQMIQAPQR